MNVSYNGWSNYETWLWVLWGMFEGSCGNKDRVTLAYDLQESAEAYAKEIILDQSGPVADLLGNAISNINWFEIADHLLEEEENSQ